MGNTVKFPHMAVRFVPKTLNPVVVIFFVSKEFGVIDPEALEAGNIKYIITLPTVRIYNAIRYSFSSMIRYRIADGAS